MSVHRRVLATALLLLIAGCSGAPLDGGEGLNAGAPSLAEFEYPDGYDEDGVSNATVAIETHRERLAATGGVVNSTRTFGGDESVTAILRIDGEEELVYNVRRRGDDVRRETFYRDGTLYRHADGDVRTVDSTYEEATERARVDPIRTVDALNFTAAGTAVVDGTVAVRYEVTGVDRRVVDVADDVESVSGELVVDEEGRVHRFEYRITIDESDGPVTYTGTYEATYGETAVEEPDWVVDAEPAGEGA